MNDDTTLYDEKKNRLLTNDDLPDGLDTNDLIRFCQAHDYNFVSLGPPFAGPMWDENSVFRVIMINETLSRDRIIPWTKVSNWMDVQATRMGYRH